MNISARIDMQIPPSTRSLLRALGALAASNGFSIYLVGGIVRDLFLSRPNLDIDIAVDGDGPAFAALVADKMNGSVVMHGRFGTSVVILPGKIRVDIAAARTETYSRPGALPEVAFASIKYDLKRRDFSINAMAVSLNPADFGELADFYNGLSDLESGLIRSLYPASFVDDPTRILRAARFEAAFGFSVDSPTEAGIREAVAGGYLGKVSGARLRKEIFLIAEGPGADIALRRLGDFGVWQAMTPGLKPDSAAYQIGRASCRERVSIDV
jgi:tRNA nucleotidyltransferase (CCA-adding enzyme)